VADLPDRLRLTAFRPAAAPRLPRRPGPVRGPSVRGPSHDLRYPTDHGASLRIRSETRDLQPVGDHEFGDCAPGAARRVVARMPIMTTRRPSGWPLSRPG